MLTLMTNEMDRRNSHKFTTEQSKMAVILKGSLSEQAAKFDAFYSEHLYDHLH